MMPACSWVDAGKISRNIHQIDQGNIKGIAEPDETGGFVGCIHIQTPGFDSGLIGDNADAAAVHARKADDDIGGKAGQNFEKILIVDNPQDHLVHVVGFFKISRNDFFQAVVDAVGIVVVCYHRWLLIVIGRQIAEQFFDDIDTLRITVGHKVGLAGFFTVNFGAAKFFEAEVLTGDRFDNRRPGNDHMALSFYHDNKVGQSR